MYKLRYNTEGSGPRILKKKNLRTVSKFQAPEGWRKSNFILITHEYQSPPCKLQYPRRPCARVLCIPDIGSLYTRCNRTIKNKKHFTLEINTESSSETSVAAYQTIRFHNLEDHDLNLHFCYKKSLNTLSKIDFGAQMQALRSPITLRTKLMVVKQVKKFPAF